MSARRPFYALARNGVRLFVRATPGAGRDEIAGLWTGAGGEERLAVKVAAPPDRGRANDAIINLVAKRLGVAKSAVAVAAGEGARLKTLEIKGDPETLAAALDAMAGAER